MRAPHTLLPLLLVIPAACGGQATAAADPEPQVPAQEAEPAPEDPAQKELERVTEEVKAEVEELRGERFSGPVQVAVSDAEEFRAYVKRRIEATETPEAIAADEEVAKLLGILPPDFDYLQTMLELVESQVGGFYDPPTKTFYLMEGFEGDLARVILAHELTHALDDQLFDLDDDLEALRDDADAEWAYYSVIEGSGTIVMQRWSVQHMKELEPSEMQEMASMGMEELKEAPTFLWKPLIGAYLKGQAFLAARPEDMEVPAAIRRAFEAPPRSSEQILHPEKYWDEAQRDEPRPVRFERAALPEGWEVRGENALGELGIGFLVEPLKWRGGVSSPFALMSPRLTWKASEGWGGDRWLLLGRGEDRVLVLSTAWDSAAEAREFAEAVEELRPHILAGAAQDLAVTLEESRVDVVATRGAGRELAEAARAWARFE